jgi:hypothetical protein
VPVPGVFVPVVPTFVPSMPVVLVELLDSVGGGPNAGMVLAPDRPLS